VSERRLLALGAALTVVMAVAAALLLGTAGPAESSSLSRASGGWLAARRYLEERGTPVALIDHSLEEPPGEGVLVLAFPWQSFAFDDVTDAVERHLRGGGVVLLAYAERSDATQSAVLAGLGLGWEERRPRPPLGPRRWRAYAAEEWSLTPAEAGARNVRVAARRYVPALPAHGEVLLRDAQGRAVAFAFPRRRGRVVALPADVFANARVTRPGNADFLESLRQDLRGAWLFDEFHHGLRAASGPAQAGPQHVFLLYVLQIALVYALCALAVVRRFGPAWQESRVASGSAATFLVGLGALHDRLGHHPAAARLLVERARELDPRLRLPPPEAYDGKAFLSLARRVGARQSGGKSA
jgi:hypothetical protein